MIHDLNLRDGSYGLGNACGVGLQAVMLAEEVGSDGLVTGLDISTEILDIGRTIIEEAGRVFAPFDKTSRRALEALFEMRWSNVESELSLPRINEFRRLCTPDSPDYILNIPEYYAYFTYSLFKGTKE
jgi:hypothetical protein